MVDQLFMGEDVLNIFEPEAINSPFQKEFLISRSGCLKDSSEVRFRAILEIGYELINTLMNIVQTITYRIDLGI